MQLIETIKCKDGKLENLDFHQARLENTQKEYLGKSQNINLFEIEIPDYAQAGLYRCRITFLKSIEKIEFFKHEYRKIKTLKIVEDSSIDYHLKFANRNHLLKLYQKREKCDDIIIVKDGFVTDSFAANIVLFNGKHWVTPNTPLLPGTQRAKLLKENKIIESEIKIDKLWTYRKIGLINALNDFNEMPVIDIKNVVK